MSDPLPIYNYAVGFVDLLGQKNEYIGQGLLPKFDSPQAEEAFLRKAWGTIGTIDALQKDCLKIITTLRDYTSPDREMMPDEIKAIYDQMRLTALETQMWSDGVVYFSSLGKKEIKVPTNAFFTMISSLGTLCFLGLAKQRPLRGGLEIAWGVELTPGNLYGCAVAKAYELESTVAKYPRIVVGPYYMGYLKAQSHNTGTDVYSRLNKSFADSCLGMLVQDTDGQYIIHYLGQTYQSNIGTGIHQALYNKALEFIRSSLERFRSEKDMKHTDRYLSLLQYYEKYPPNN